MKISFVLPVLLLGLSVPVYADIYQWIDDSGVVNFTDKPENVPKKYQHKVKILASEDTGQESMSPESTASESQPALPADLVQQSAQQNLYGGHDEQWWRSQYGSLRGELMQLQNALPGKRAALEQLRRKLVVFTFSRNRVAYQEKLAEIQQDEERIQTLTEQLKSLDAQAAAAGVPFAWRQ